MKARAVVILCPCPTMMPDKMGIIGKMQGLNAINRPNPKKLAATNQMESFFNESAIRSCSAIGAGPGSALAVGKTVLAVEIVAGSCRLTVFSIGE